MVTQLISKHKELEDCPQDKVFWLSDGRTLKNMHELRDALESMDENTFRYHVNKENGKNDFATWALDVLGDSVLARQLHGVIDQKKYAKVVKKRINHLE